MTVLLQVLLIVTIWSVIMVSEGFDVDILSGRKDPDTCCDKLENNTFSDNCQQTILTAMEDAKFAYSPGFPNQFPMQKLCSWGIYAKPGKRIRLEFRDFYLIGPGDDGICFSQGVVVKSPLTGKQMGPHCGNAGLPTIISPGNYLVVELISNIPMTSENYRGFKMAFAESVETPSHELRPVNWDGDVALTANPLVVQRLFPASVLPSANRPAKSTRKSSRFNPTRRPINIRGPVPDNNHLAYTQPPGRFTPQQPPKKDSHVLSLEEIVGIAIGGTIVLAILVVIGVKCYQSRQARIRKEKKMETRPKLPEKENSKQKYQTDNFGNVQEIDRQNLANAYQPGMDNVILPPGYYFYYHNEENGKVDPMIERDPFRREMRMYKPSQNQVRKHHPLHKKRNKDKIRSLRTLSITRPRRRKAKPDRVRKLGLPLDKSTERGKEICKDGGNMYKQTRPETQIPTERYPRSSLERERKSQTKTVTKGRNTEIVSNEKDLHMHTSRERRKGSRKSNISSTEKLRRSDDKSKTMKRKTNRKRSDEARRGKRRHSSKTRKN